MAESEDLSPLETSEEKCDKKCDISETVSKDCTKNIEVKEDVPAEDEKRDRKPPVRRPSLLKTVVNIKHDQPVTVVNYSEDVTPTKTESAGTTSDHEESFKTPGTDLDATKDPESFISAMDTSSSASVADDSLVTEVAPVKDPVMETSNETVTMNGVVDNDDNKEDECGNLVRVPGFGESYPQAYSSEADDVFLHYLCVLLPGKRGGWVFTQH